MPGVHSPAGYPLPMWHHLAIRACPIDVLSAVSEAVSSAVVTVENHRLGDYARWGPVQIGLARDEPAVRHQVRNLTTDIELTRAQFIARMPQWNRTGVYAIFAARSLPMRVSDLPRPHRHRILQNFDAQLEFSMGDGTQDGFGVMWAPDERLVRLAEQVLVDLGKTALIETRGTGPLLG